MGTADETGGVAGGVVRAAASITSDAVRTWRVPMVGQNTAPDPNGGVDWQHADDCGESCVSMYARYFTGLDVGPGCVRQMMGGHESSGISDGQDLARVLRGFGIDCAVWSGPAAEQFTVCMASIVAKKGYICLGYWLSREVGHWRAGIGYAGNGSTRENDPWLREVVAPNVGVYAAAAMGSAILLHTAF